VFSVPVRVEKLFLLGVNYPRIAVAEARGQFRNPEEGERPPLEAVNIELVKTR
jgi:hypothetical protein